MSRRRAVLAAAVAAVAVVGVLAAALASSGGADPATAAGEGVAWQGRAQVLRTPELPDDTVLRSELRNVSLRDVVLDADRSRLLDAAGRPVAAVVRFTGAFGHGLYSPRNAPREVAEAERERLGERVVLRPDRTVPVTLSWRVPAGGSPPVVLDLGGQRLELPAAAGS